MKTNTTYVFAVIVVLILIVIPFAYGAFRTLPSTPIYQFSTSTPMVVVTSTVATSTTATTSSPTQPSAPTPVSTIPSITSISPASGTVGTLVTLQGANFSVFGNTVLFGGGPIDNVASSQGGTVLTFAVPDSVGADCKPDQACPMYARLITPGTYTITVRTSVGTSNQAPFIVTGSSTTF